jgi:hypothetical protein
VKLVGTLENQCRVRCDVTSRPSDTLAETFRSTVREQGVGSLSLLGKVIDNGDTVLVTDKVKTSFKNNLHTL